MSTTKRPKAEPLALYVTCERLSFEPGTRKLTFSIGRTKADHDADCYTRDVERWPTPIGVLRVKDLAAITFAKPGDAGASRMPTSGVEYRDVHSLDLRDAEAMVATLRTIDRAMRRITERFGHAESLASWLRRVCDVLGVTEIRIERDAVAIWRKPSEYENDGTCWYTRDVPSGVSCVDRIVDAIVEPKTVESERAS